MDIVLAGLVADSNVSLARLVTVAQRPPDVL
jgi:hypothetical protein